MITGDHPRTASVIARELGISVDGRATTGAELERLSPDALARMAADVSVYARVNPEHKLRIVDALKRSGRRWPGRSFSRSWSFTFRSCRTHSAGRAVERPGLAGLCRRRELPVVAAGSEQGDAECGALGGR